MFRKRAVKIALTTMSLAACSLLMSLPAMAQCAMCKTGVSGSPDAGRLSQNLNFAVIILLIPPVLIFCGLFFLAYKHRRARGTSVEQSSPDDGERRQGFSKSTLRRKRKNEREAGGAAA